MIGISVALTVGDSQLPSHRYRSAATQVASFAQASAVQKIGDVTGGKLSLVHKRNCGDLPVGQPYRPTCAAAVGHQVTKADCGLNTKWNDPPVEDLLNHVPQGRAVSLLPPPIIELLDAEM